MTARSRHGVATFVPAGQTIKIINKSGGQVVDTWAFALPQPAPRKDIDQQAKDKEEESKETTGKAAEQIKTKSNDLPSQEEAERATSEAQVQDQKQGDGADKKSTWSSYMPSMSTLGMSNKEDGGQEKGDQEKSSGGQTQQQKNSKTWASYFKPGKGFSSYIPQQATDTVSKFVSAHNRDTSKSYLEQLTDFSKTPVGAAGMSAFTGSGYSGSLYAGYQAWNAKNAADAPNMEYMSMGHTRTATLHLVPRKGDTLVTNLREPILTIVEDKSSGVHDTLIPACDPQRYKSLGVHQWEEHGSCAENLVLALKELNERAGLKGAKAVGASVTINDCPAPLNLFMNIPWTDNGDLSFKAPKNKAGDYVRLKAERDVVVVMSACPNDVQDINNNEPTDASFIVEEEGTADAIKRTQPSKKKFVPQNKPAANTTASTPAATPAKKKPPPPSAPPPAKKTPLEASQTPKAAPKKNSPPSKPPPAQPVKNSAQPATKPAQPATKATRKPVPPAVKPQVNGTTNGTSVEKKKPRKLVRQPTQS